MERINLLASWVNLKILIITDTYGTTYICLRTEVDEDSDESGSGAVDSFLDQVAVEDPFPSLFKDDVFFKLWN